MTKTLIVGIPAFNEAETIYTTIKTIHQEIEAIENVSGTILVVNDGSTDDTAALAEQAGATVISHNVNSGVGIAFQSMISYCLEAKTDYLVTIDADGQFDPTQISALLAPLMAGKAVMVTGNRFTANEARPKFMSKAKYIGNKIVARIVSKLVAKDFKDVSCGFRAYSQEALLHLNLHGKFTYTQETFINLSLKKLPIISVPVRVKYFEDRKSRVVKSIADYALNSGLIILRTYRDFEPMRFFIAIASFWGMIGLITGGFSVIRFILYSAFSPYLFVVFVAAFCIAFSIIFLIVALVADMYSRLNRNQERLLYLMKKAHYK